MRSSIDFASLVWRGIVAGWLIAIWLLPFAESARVCVIIILAYLVGLAQLAYVIAGSWKRSIWSLWGDLSFVNCVASFLLPTLIGNVIGGVPLSLWAHTRSSLKRNRN